MGKEVKQAEELTSQQKMGKLIELKKHAEEGIAIYQKEIEEQKKKEFELWKENQEFLKQQTNSIAPVNQVIDNSASPQVPQQGTAFKPVKPGFMSIARDEGIYDPSKPEPKGGKIGMLQYGIIIGLAVLINIIIGQFNGISKSTYVSDITRLENDFVAVRAAIKSDGDRLTNFTASIATVNDQAGRIGTLTNQVNDLNNRVNTVSAQTVNISNQLVLLKAGNGTVVK